MPVWSVPRAWEGETCFIVAGGPSVSKQNLDLLSGRKVIAINSSYQRVPCADYLFFGDSRWWREHFNKLGGVASKLVSVSPAAASDKRVLYLKKVNPPGLSMNPKELVMRRTSLHAAMNFAALLGVSGMVLLGADGKPDAKGRTHHHTPHKWPQRPGCWDEQRKDLDTIRKPLKKLGIKVFNASPGSAWGDLWPVVSLEDVLDDEGSRARTGQDREGAGETEGRC